VLDRPRVECRKNRDEIVCCSAAVRDLGERALRQDFLASAEPLKILFFALGQSQLARFRYLGSHLSSEREDALFGHGSEGQVSAEPA
jgi:hypothetical protein